MLKNIFTATLVLSAFAMAGCEPQYDHDQPDTTANRAGFQRHFGFPASEATSKLYYYADALGADATYQLGFQTDRDTVNQIVEKHGLVAADTKIDVPLGREFEWWVPDEIKNLPAYWKKTEGKEHYRHLWYSEETSHAFYLEHSL